MRKISVLIILTLLIQIFLPQSAAAFADLPPLLPDTVGVKVTGAIPGDPAYFPTVIVTGGTILDGIYPGWCADTDQAIDAGTAYSAYVYSSYETLPSGLVKHPENLDLVNWIINQEYVGKTFPGGINPYYYGDVQVAIWTLLEGAASIPPNLPGIGPYAPSHIARIVADATTSGEGFIPSGDEQVAIILDTFTPGNALHSQPIIVCLKLACLGDLVWNDTDQNGIQDAGEAGIAGVTVNLYNSLDNLLATTTTNANGEYNFTVVPGQYYIQFMPPAGYVFSPQNQGGDDAKDSDADTTTGNTALITLVAGQTDLTWDAGLYVPPTVQPDISVSPTSLDFGPVQVGISSASQNVTVTNSGTANLIIGSLTITNSQFAITGGDISGQSLAPGISANISLVFTPSATGAQSANLTIPSNDPDLFENPLIVALSGSGASTPTTPDISVSPTSIDFGPVQVGISSASQNVTVTNSGTANLIIGTITITNSQFAITGGDISGQTLAPNASANISLAFTPSATGAQSANLTIPSNDPDENPVSVALSGSGSSTPTTPDISVSPTSIDFGPVQVGISSASQNVTVTNTGTANLIIGTITITGAGASQFAIVSDNASSQTLAPGVSANISLAFTPSATGAQSANLTIPSNDPDLFENPVSVALSGSGSSTPTTADISINPAFIDFGPVQVGISSASQNVTVTNSGTANLIIGSLTITNSQFTITGGDISGQSLAPGISANISLVFTPSATGAQSANLTIPSNDPDLFENPVSVALSGSGSSTPTTADISVSPASLDFGPVQVGISSASQNVTVTNSGTANLIIGTITITGAGASQFAIVSDNASSQTLAPGVSANISLAFTPSATGAQSANLTIPSNDPDLFENPVSVALSGSGSSTPTTADISINPAFIDFGPVQVGISSASQNVTVTNSGTANLIIGSLTITNSQFTITGGDISGQSLAPGISANISLVFTPSATGAQSANLTIPSNDPDLFENPVSVALSGSGSSTPTTADISVSPASLDFGPVQVGISSASQNVTVTNSGTANLIIGTITITGAGASQFAIVSDNASSQTLAPGVSANISLAFTPSATGAQSANLTIPSNDPDLFENPVSVPLSGSGSSTPTTADISINPASLDFGPVQVGISSASQNVTVTNSGTANLIIGSLTITNSQFTITGGDISGQSLAPGVSANISLAFTPSGTGAQSANLTIPSNDPDLFENPVSVPLSGSGSSTPTTPDISVSPASLDFGPVQVGISSASQNVTVTNSGTANLIIGTITITNSQFAITGGDISGQSLAPNASANISLAFTPSATGAQSANLTIPSNDPDENPVSVPLSGSGSSTPPPSPPPTPTTTAPLYFTVDFLGKITRELATSDGRPVKLMEAPSPDGMHLLEIEALTGAKDNVSNTVTLIEIRETEAPQLPENTRLVGKAYEFKPTGTVFDKPVKLTLGYNVNELPDRVTSVGAAYYSTKDGWIYLDTEATNVAELGKLTAPINHFTVFAVLAKVSAAPEIDPPIGPSTEPELPVIPASFNLSNLSITPSVCRIFEKLSYIVRTGKDALITVDVTNNGGQTGSYTAVLNLNGTERERKEITLDPGQTGTVSFTVTGNEHGSYTVLIGNLKGSFLSNLWINRWLIAGTIGVIALIIWLVWYIFKRKKRGQIPT